MNNPGLYNGALTGVIAGFVNTRFTAQTDPAIYAALIAEAEAFATILDGLIPFDSTLNDSKTQTLTTIVTGAFASRYQVGGANVNAGLTALAQGLAVLYTGTATALTPIAPAGASYWQLSGGGSLEPATAQAAVSIAAAGSTPTDGQESAAFAGGIASGLQSCGVAGGDATGQNSFAGCAGSTTGADNDCALAGGDAVGGSSFAACAAAFGGGPGSATTGLGAAALSCGQAHGTNSFAACSNTAVAVGTFDCAIGLATNANSSGSGNNIGCVALCGGTATGDASCAVAMGTASGTNSFASSGGNASGTSATAVSGASATAAACFAANVGSIAGGGSVVGSTALCGGETSADGCAAIGSNVCTVPNSFKLGTDGGSLFSSNADGTGTTQIDCGANQKLAIGNVATQSTVGAAGGASALPVTPSGYLALSLPGLAATFVIPYYLPA
jgi:hypothetical protein